MPALPGRSVPASTARFPHEALEQFRTRLLCRYRCLHDAFSVALASSSSEKVALGPKELRTSLARIGQEETDELFAASGMSWQGCTHTGMTLLQFFHELVGVSSEALLWELRCRLASCNLWPRPSDPESLRSFVSVSIDEADAPLLRLDHDLWLRFCTQLGLTSVEAQGLYKMLSDGAGSVDIDHMFVVVRATVASDASLMQLADKLLSRYGSFRDAYATVCMKSDRVMKWREFQKLTFASEFGKQSSEKLWTALRHVESPSRAGDNGTLVAEEMEIDDDASNRSMELPGSDVEGLSENEFVQRLVCWAPDLLRWSPDSVLHELECELNRKFDGFSECRRALRQQGLPGSFELSPKRLKAGLASVGILRCDADVLLDKVRLVLGKTSEDRQVTFDDLIQAIRDTSPMLSKKNSTSPGAVRKALLKEWRQSDDGICASSANVDCSTWPSCAASHTPSVPSTRAPSLPSTRAPSACDDGECSERWAAKDSSLHAVGTCRAGRSAKSRHSSQSSTRAPSLASVASLRSMCQIQ